jgi:hypothetical protein
VAVAKLLTDLNSASTMQNIWSVIRAFQANPPPTEPVNLELFWDRWLSEIGINNPPSLNTIYGNRSIIYAIDGFEGDNTIATAQTYTTGFSQIHTLYATVDEDFIRFTATSSTHTIRTENLMNGADTYLSLYDSSGAFITANDNAVTPTQFPPNSTTALSSRIPYSFIITGNKYYVSVKSSSSRPASTGKYGSYTLVISP